MDALNRHRRAEGGTACSAVHQQVKQQQGDKKDVVTAPAPVVVKQSPAANATSSSSYHRTHHKNTSGSSCSSSSSSIPQQAQAQTVQQSQSPPTITIPPSTTTIQRPVIPQLHIPHPASHLYPREPSNTNYNNSPSPNIPLSHSPPLNKKGPPLLPSPSALSTLPIANNNNLTPIYSPANSKSNLPSTPSSPPHTQHHKHSKSPLYHPYQQPWSPYRSSNSNNSERPTLPPLSSSSSPPPPSLGSPPTTTKQNNLMDRLAQENEELKRDINQLRAMAQKEANALKSRVHDLEVEVKRECCFYYIKEGIITNYSVSVNKEQGIEITDTESSVIISSSNSV